MNKNLLLVPLFALLTQSAFACYQDSLDIKGNANAIATQISSGPYLTGSIENNGHTIILSAPVCYLGRFEVNVQLQTADGGSCQITLEDSKFDNCPSVRSAQCKKIHFDRMEHIGSYHYELIFDTNQ